MKGFRLFLLSASVVIGAAILSHVQGAAPDATLPGPFGPPSWDTIYPAKERFLVLTQFNNEAVLDRETGLVWQRSPIVGTETWALALASCREQIIGDRKGWRLPSYEEMSTLVEPKRSNPDLPADNPFENFTPTDSFWTATTYESDQGRAYFIAFQTASSANSGSKGNFSRAWCVRGGQSATNPF